MLALPGNVANSRVVRVLPQCWRPLFRRFAVLSHVWTGGREPQPSAEGSPRKICIMMHGILGSKSNWNTPARQLQKIIGPLGWHIIQIDHRAHGKSPAGEAPHTLEACADDTLETLRFVGVDPEKDDLVVCGHSFGGKVALAVLKSLLTVGNPPRKTWLFDSIPGNPVVRAAKVERKEQSVQFVLGTVIEMAQFEFPDRVTLIETLVNQHGVSKPLAQWVAQNVKNTESGGVCLSYDVDAVQAMYEAYRKNDMWDLIEAGQADIGVVVAGRCRGSWGEANLQRLELAANKRIETVILEGSGHNVHVDDLPGLLAAIKPTFENLPGSQANSPETTDE